MPLYFEIKPTSGILLTFFTVALSDKDTSLSSLKLLEFIQKEFYTSDDI